MGSARKSPLAAAVLLGVLVWPALGTGCPDDAETDLCATTTMWLGGTTVGHGETTMGHGETTMAPGGEEDDEMPTNGASRLSPSTPMVLSFVLALSVHMHQDKGTGKEEKITITND